MQRDEHILSLITDTGIAVWARIRGFPACRPPYQFASLGIFQTDAENGAWRENVGNRSTGRSLLGR